MALVLVGQPNTGKSSVFARLTGEEVMVANYPGTSVEVSKGQLELGEDKLEVFDTPGIYSLVGSEKQKAVVRMLLEEKASIIVQVMNACSLAHGLALTFELLGFGKPLVLVLNQIDRAKRLGIEIDGEKLEEILGCPVICFSTLTGQGLDQLLKIIEQGAKGRLAPPRSPQEVWLTDDVPAGCQGKCCGCEGFGGRSCNEHRMWEKVQMARILARQVVKGGRQTRKGLLEKIEKILDMPIVGSIALLIVIVIGYQFLVGMVGAGEILSDRLLPMLEQGVDYLVSRFIHEQHTREFMVQAISEGVLVPVGTVMPAMLAVYVILSFLEETGLIVRYAVLLDRLGRVFGVPGQAVVPLSLGFGCRTPAVVATRILPEEGQRYIVMSLLAVVIPCAATVAMAGSAVVTFHANLLVIVGTMLLVFLVLGKILSLKHGQSTEMVYEVPPLEWPDLEHMWRRVKMGFAEFFAEVLPLLLLMSVAVRVIIESGVLRHIETMQHLARGFFGIPAEAMMAVAITILQRHLAPLVLLNLPLSPREATIGITMVTLSVPCLPVAVMIFKEAGGRALAKILGIGIVISLLTGFLLNLVLPR